MATRRDQLQSYQFLLQRVISALVYRKTDPAQSPFRRAGGAVFAGVMLSILALAVTAAIGFFAKGFGAGDDWTEGHAVIVNAETGSQYVVYPADDEKKDVSMPQRLYPVTNYASAVLLAGSPTQISVDSADLAGEDVPERGMEVGIPNAPDSVPDTDHLLTAGWAVCSAQEKSNTGNVTPVSYAFVGSHPHSGKALNDGQALNIQAKDGDTRYLVWNNYKFSVKDDAAISALGLNTDQPSEVSQAYINALPDGGEIKVPSIKDAGEDTEANGADKIGQVLKYRSHSKDEYYVALADGAAAITKVQADLLLNDPDIKSDAYDGEDAEPLSVESTPSPTVKSKKPDASKAGMPPADRPSFVSLKADAASCATYNTKGEATKVTTGAHVEKGSGVATEQVSQEHAALAEYVSVPPGKAALVASGSSDESGGALLLVTDTGKTYPLGSKEVAGILGYGKATPVHVDSGVVNLLPPGLPDGGELSVDAAQISTANAP